MKREELIKTIETMDLPEMRKELTPTNVRWLLRNIQVRHSKHEKIKEVVKGLIQMTKETNDS